MMVLNRLPERNVADTTDIENSSSMEAALLQIFPVRKQKKDNLQEEDIFCFVIFICFV